MKILIDDGMQIKVGTGIGKYSKYMYEELKCFNPLEYIVDLHSFDKKNSSKEFGRLNYLKFINSATFQKMTEQYDYVHFTNYAIPFVRNKKSKYIATIHDLAAFKHPETFSKRYYLYIRFITNYTMKHADVILTVSKSAQKEIIEKWPLFQSKVFYIYPGFYSEFTQSEIKTKYESSLLKNLHSKKFFYVLVQ